MSVLLFSISSTSLLSKPETNSDSNDGHTHTQPHKPSSVLGHCPPPPLSAPRGRQSGGVNQLDDHVHPISSQRAGDNLAY